MFNLKILPLRVFQGRVTLNSFKLRKIYIFGGPRGGVRGGVSTPAKISKSAKRGNISDPVGF